MTMFAYLLRRLVQVIVVFWAVATAVFITVDYIGNPASLMLPPDATQDQIKALSHQLHLDDPLPVRYWHFLTGLLHGNLGTSSWTGTGVTGSVAHYFPPTFLLALVTVLIALVLGIGLGTLAGIFPESIVDRFVSFISYVGVAFPEFWLGLLLIAFLAVKVRAFPTSGYGGPAFFVLPVITLLARPIGRFAETTRVSLRSELGKDYVFLVSAMGLKPRTVVGRHALRNSLLAVLTLAGDELAVLVAGSVAVEVIFAWPGTGYLSYQAINQRDPALIVGIVLAVCAVVLILNFVLDLVYRVLDPRIGLTAK
jgi:ABC-type dipeptide/oligopeptide/nickel transport system permease component